VTDNTEMPVIVVAAAVIDGDGRLLAARRNAPEAHAGGWEFPGGKVEPGESDKDALVRELKEELGVTVEVGERVGDEWPLQPGYVMRVYRARIIEGEPEPLEDHDLVRWLDAGAWWSVSWLNADRPVIDALESSA
jgi:8-oxo-dGTP diphosphatase